MFTGPAPDASVIPTLGKQNAFRPRFACWPRIAMSVTRTGFVVPKSDEL
jgi:hypothetical protein